MARVTLTADTLPGGYPSLQPAADSLDLTFTAADAVNFEETASTGKEILFAYNSGAGARTVTISSVADERKRTGDITAYSIDAGERAAFGPFPTAGWKQTDGMLYFQAEHAEVFWAVLRLP